MRKKVGKAIYTDDGVSSRRIIPTLLEHTGYIVIEVLAEEDLITEATQLLPDLILMYYPFYGLPGCRSSQAHRRLKMNSLTKHIPIIMLVHKSDTELSMLEVNRIVELPIDVDEFRALLESYLPVRNTLPDE